MRSTLALLLMASAATLAAAHPPPDRIYIVHDDPPPPPPKPDPTDWRASPALVEWSTWLGVGFGVASTPPSAAARSSSPMAPSDVHTGVVFAAGVDMTLPLSHSVRIGPWVGLADLEPIAGGELQITRAPTTLDMFWYRGEGTFTVRVGAGADHSTAAITWGYRCPWKLYGPYSRSSRYEIGARFVLAGTRSHADPHDWTTTLGLEVEPVGAFRYIFGVRSWY